MKTIFTNFIICLLAFTQPAFSQIELPEFLTDEDAGRLGLMDMGISYGLIRHKDEEKVITGENLQTKINSQFLKFHFQESMLSNYWSDSYEDGKVRIGFTETLDLGVSYSNIKEELNGTKLPAPENEKKVHLLFAYEAGFAGVYKIDDRMDVGFTYYVFSLSNLNKETPAKYGKILFRYNHLMTALSFGGRKAIDIRYIMNGDFIPYFGLTYTGWKDASVPEGAWSTGEKHIFFTMGWIL